GEGLLGLVEQIHRISSSAVQKVRLGEIHRRVRLGPPITTPLESPVRLLQDRRGTVQLRLGKIGTSDEESAVRDAVPVAERGESLQGGQSLLPATLVQSLPVGDVGPFVPDPRAPQLLSQPTVG